MISWPPALAVGCRKDAGQWWKKWNSWKSQNSNRKNEKSLKNFESVFLLDETLELQRGHWLGSVGKGLN